MKFEEAEMPSQDILAGNSLFCHHKFDILQPLVVWHLF